MQHGLSGSSTIKDCLRQAESRGAETKHRLLAFFEGVEMGSKAARP